MTRVNVDVASADLPELIAAVERTGDEIVICRDGVPVARLVPGTQPLGPRRLGGWGPVVIHDDFAVLPDDLAAAFGVPET